MSNAHLCFLSRSQISQIFGFLLGFLAQEQRMLLPRVPCLLKAIGVAEDFNFLYQIQYFFSNVIKIIHCRYNLYRISYLGGEASKAFTLHPPSLGFCKWDEM